MHLYQGFCLLYVCLLAGLFVLVQVVHCVLRLKSCVIFIKRNTICARMLPASPLAAESRIEQLRTACAVWAGQGAMQGASGGENQPLKSASAEALPALPARLPSPGLAWSFSEPLEFTTRLRN